jgi:hypothetical protein
MSNLPDGFVLDQPPNQQAAPALPDGFVIDHPSMWQDAVKSTDAGIGKGLTTLLGLPGDVATFAHGVAPQGVTDAIKSVPGANWLYNHLPGSEALKATIPTDFSANYNKDAEYEPQYATGRYTKAIAQAVPMMATGMGVLPTLGSALGGQAASDLTGGNPYATFGGNVLGGFAGPMTLARLATGGKRALMGADEVRAAADAAYKDPAIKTATLSSQAARNVAFDMKDLLDNSGTPFLKTQAPLVHEAVNNLAATTNDVRIADLHGLRKQLGDIAQEKTPDWRMTEQAKAAQDVKKLLDHYLDNIPTQDVVSGNPAQAVGSIRQASKDWQAASNAQQIDNAIGNAKIASGSTGSGMNLGNVLRQQFKPFLKNDAAKLSRMGYGGDPEVINGVRNVVQGDLTTNLLRHASNMLGGGGGIGSTLIGHGIWGAAGGAEGYKEGGLPGAILGTALSAVPGQTLRLLANARTLKAAQAVQQSILAKAPANAAINKVNSVVQAARLRAYTQGARNAALQTDLLARKYNNGGN